MWYPVLISAATAAFVTLAVEYFAKPNLEVRKDRILEIARTWRDLEIQLETLLSARVLVRTGTERLP